MQAKLESLSAADLLRIPLGEPERLFDRAALKSQYHTLLKAWHPDSSADPQAGAVTMHLYALYERAKEKLEAGVWGHPHTRLLVTNAGKKYEIRYRASKAFELGEMLIGDTILVYLLDPVYRDLYDRARCTIAGATFADERMRNSIEPYLPHVEAAFETTPMPDAAARLVLVIRKTKDVLVLADVIAHLGGAMDARHVAWIISCLQNLACWLQWAQLSHNAISPEAVFISPSRHTVSLLGGWWYATRIGSRLIALPQRTVATMPRDALRSKHADPRIDQTLIRLLGRELLGAVRSADPTSAPAPLLTWLHLAPTGAATNDYAEWESVRANAFGERRFFPFNLTADDLYPDAGVTAAS